MNELNTVTQSIKAEIDAMNAAFAAKKKELTTGLQQKLADLTKVAFDENPKLLAICWTQYTPYFNDGDPCEFSMGEVNALLLNEEITEQIMDGESIDDILAEDYYEGNIPYGMQYAPMYRKYLATGELDFTGTYMAYSHYNHLSDLEKIAQLCSEWVTKYPQTDETSLAKFDHDLGPITQAKEVTNAIANIPEEIMEELFGDHVRVIITKDGIDVQEYDHD